MKRAVEFSSASEFRPAHAPSVLVPHCFAAIRFAVIRFSFASFASFALKLLALAFVCCTGIAPATAAETYPTRPIRLIVPYAPGGNVDITARVIGPGMGDALGQTIVVDNRAGGGGNVGANLVARAAPDGYTLLMGSSGPLSINPIVFKDIPYDSVKDFAPISAVHIVPLVVIVRQKSTIGSVQDLVTRMKASPGKVTMASAGTGSTNHFAIELFAAMTGTRPLHIPYKGSGPALTELLGGQVETMIDQLTGSIGYIRDGRVKLVAVTGKRRSPALPNVPTLEEAGLKGYEASTYIGVLAPAGTSPAVVTKLNAAVRKVMGAPDVLDRLRTLGTEPGASSPQEFRAMIADELGKWREVARRANLKFD
jgi:tripartite-type tricarboxylate transporter receptor subunit TctC